MKRESAYQDRGSLDEVAFVEIQDPENCGTGEHGLAMALAFELFHLLMVSELLASCYLQIFRVRNKDQNALVLSAQDLHYLIFLNTLFQKINNTFISLEIPSSDFYRSNSNQGLGLGMNYSTTYREYMYNFSAFSKSKNSFLFMNEEKRLK